MVPGGGSTDPKLVAARICIAHRNIACYLTPSGVCERPPRRDTVSPAAPVSSTSSRPTRETRRKESSSRPCTKSTKLARVTASEVVVVAGNANSG